VRHEEHGRKYVYLPVAARSTVRKSALRHVVETFYEGSVEKVVAALLGGDAARLTDDELNRIGELVRKAKKEGV
jgi:predicted transcriptional regulator